MSVHSSENAKARVQYLRERFEQRIWEHLCRTGCWETWYDFCGRGAPNLPLNQLASRIFDFVLSLDPDQKDHSYSQTLLRWLMNDWPRYDSPDRYNYEGLTPRVLERVANDIRLFLAISASDNYPGQRDIGRFASHRELSSIVKGFQEYAFLPPSRFLNFDVQYLQEHGGYGARLLFHDNAVRLYALESHEAAMDYGRGSSWCTSYKTPRHFKQYRHDILFLLTSAGDRYQISFSAGQFEGPRRDNQKKAVFEIFNARSRLCDVIADYYHEQLPQLLPRKRFHNYSINNEDRFFKILSRLCGERFTTRLPGIAREQFMLAVEMDRVSRAIGALSMAAGLPSPEKIILPDEVRKSVAFLGNNRYIHAMHGLAGRVPGWRIPDWRLKA